MTPSDRAVYREMLKRDFGAFVQRCFRQLNPSADYLGGWHIDLIASVVEGVRTEPQQLIINLPPRHLKSLIGSVALPAWLLGHNPSLAIICVSYGSELSDKLSRDCRAIMESKWYQGVFRTRLNRSAVNELTTTSHGFRLATSVGGVLTGRGADIIIVDDPLKPDEALSDTTRTRVNEWFESTLYSRLNNKRTGSIVVVMQRLHEEDLTGYLLARGGWKKLVLPAIAEQYERHTIRSLFRTREVERRAGEALHPAREDLDVLAKLRSTIGEYNFAGQYQQSPAPRDGGMIKRAWFRNYAPRDRPQEFATILQSWDTANKPNALGDYSVCTTWGVTRNEIYLLHVFRKKLNYPDLKRAVCEQADYHAATVVLIEDKASGTQLIQELGQERMLNVRAYQPAAGLDKQMRMHAQTGAIENGLVLLPEQAEWLDAYIHELTTFPKGKHDDQVDSTSQALHWIKVGQPKTPGIILYYEQELARVTARAGLAGFQPKRQ